MQLIEPKTPRRALHATHDARPMRAIPPPGEEGVVTAEYAVLLALVATVAIAALAVLGLAVAGLITTGSGAIPRG